MQYVSLQAWLGGPDGRVPVGDLSPLAVGVALPTPCAGSSLRRGDWRLTRERAGSPASASGDDGVRIPDISARSGGRLSNLPDATPGTKLRTRSRLRLPNCPARRLPSGQADPIPA